MILSSVKIGMVIYCSVVINVDIYASIELREVPTKVRYIDKETGDLWVTHMFKKMDRDVIRTDERSHYVKKEYGKGYLKYCKGKKND